MKWDHGNKMGFILSDFKCSRCGQAKEELKKSSQLYVKCSLCGGRMKRIIAFKGLLKTAGDLDLPEELQRDKSLLREVGPGKSLQRPWEKDREHSKVKWIEKKLPDGRIVRRPSVDLDLPKQRDLNQNLRLDIQRQVTKRRSL